MLVSRDKRAMDVRDLCRSLAESVSENLNDAFVAPLFWLLLTGPVGLWLYKCASTLDSLWGYKTERWLLLGQVAARLDDVLAFVPARLTAIAMLLTAVLLRKVHPHSFGEAAVWPGWRTVARHAKRSDSPNAGWPMATAAWLFNGRTGGPAVYHGESKQKPFMGPEEGCWNTARVRALLRHTRLSGIFAAVFGITLYWLIVM